MPRIRLGLMYASREMIEARRMLFGALPDFDVVFDEGNAAAALELVPEASVDVLVVDTRLRGLNGIEFVTKMHRRYLNPESKLPKVIMTAPFFSQQLLLEAIRSGATDLVAESDGAASLLAAIESSQVPSQTINYRELKDFFKLVGVAEGENPRWLLRLTSPTDRERQILDLIKHGHNDPKISELLGITETSVRWGVDAIMRQMGVATRAQLALALFEAGELSADSKVPKEFRNP